jgi:hypothetical protein
MPVAERSQSWVCCCSLAGVAGWNPARGHVCLFLVSVVCCQIEVSATGQSLVQRSPTECDVSDCDLEISTKRRPRSTRAKQPYNLRFYKYSLCFLLVAVPFPPVSSFLTFKFGIFQAM